MMWLDNIGHPLNPNDYVLCLTGIYSYTIQHIKKLSQRDEDLSIRKMVTFYNRVSVSDYNVISLSALGIKPEEIDAEKAGKHGYDVFGHVITVGDKVLYLHSHEMYVNTGVVTRLAPKTCIFECRLNRFGQSSYKKPYKEIISLSALQLDEKVIMRKESW